MTATAREMVRLPFSCSLESCGFSLGADTMEAHQHPKHVVIRAMISFSSLQGLAGVIFYLFSYRTFVPFVFLCRSVTALSGTARSPQH